MRSEAVNTKYGRRAKKVAAIAAFLTLAGIGSIAPASAGNGEEEGQVSESRWDDCGHGPEGSWLYSVVIPGLPFLGTETYAAGGGYVEADQLSTMAGSLATPGHGAWKMIGERKFLLTYVNLTHNADGSPAGTSKVRQIATISKSGDSYTGSGDYAYYNPDGSAVVGASGTFTITAKKIKVEAPQE